MLGGRFAIFFFFCLGEGKGESKAPGIDNPGGGEGVCRNVVGKAKYLLRGRNSHQVWHEFPLFWLAPQLKRSSPSLNPL